MKKEKDGVEKRGVVRRHLVFYLRIFDGMSSRVLGHLMDISPSGLMLLSDERMPSMKSIACGCGFPGKYQRMVRLSSGQ
ncbi:MAG TPA: hypothetical protein EYH36_08250 [Desulfocapsa sulfexigens]|nr:hypothetical protein [Desulfocapsa sulfexigens]